MNHSCCSIRRVSCVATMGLKPTARVIATGLAKRDDLNGCEAQVLFQHGDRWAVQFTMTGENVRIKEANLAPAARCWTY